MMKHKTLSIILSLFALLLGLLLPFLIAAGQDSALSRQVWPMEEGNAHYAYQGTLMNRVVALNAYLTGSTAVSASQRDDAAVPSDLLEALSVFLPVSSASAESAASFSLSPRQYSAEYRYLEIQYVMDSGTLSVIADCETGLPLRMELICPPEKLESWLTDRDLWDILREYAAHLNLGEPTDDETAISSALRSQSAQLRGTAYKATVTVVPSAGTLLLKLAASTPS